MEVRVWGLGFRVEGMHIGLEAVGAPHDGHGGALLSSSDCNRLACGGFALNFQLFSTLDVRLGMSLPAPPVAAIAIARPAARRRGGVPFLGRGAGWFGRLLRGDLATHTGGVCVFVSPPYLSLSPPLSLPLVCACV